MKNQKLTLTFAAAAALALLTSCSGQQFEVKSMTGGPVRLKLVDDVNGSEGVSSLLFIGNIYLDHQIGPIGVNGKQLQASDVFINGQNIYVSYSSFDDGGVVSKVGAVQLVKPYACDSLLTSLLDYCLAPAGSLAFPNDDIFSSYTDGTNLYAVGSTSVETPAPFYPGRLYKISLDSGKAPAAVSASQTLQSYAGTGVVGNGSNLLVTYGTSSTVSMMGGVASFNLSTLAQGNNQSLYDARYVAIDPLSSSTAYVIRGAVSSSNQGTVYKYPADASAAPAATAPSTIVTGGNTIAESKSTVVVGKTLLLASSGDGGFKVVCKSSGLTLASKAAPVITGIPSTKTVTNSLAAVPGYLFVANGEAGVQVYKFKKSNVLNGSYCDGVTLTSVGRLALDSDNSDATYINAELSANGIKPLTVTNVLGVVTSRLLVVASGNKGLSLLDISGLNLALDDIDDF